MVPSTARRTVEGGLGRSCEEAEFYGEEHAGRGGHGGGRWCCSVERSSVDIFSQLWGRMLGERIHCDNTAGVRAIKAGMSKKLSYMRRTQRVSIGFLADYIFGEDGAVLQEATVDLVADVFTKSLAVIAFWKCLRLFGIG